MNDFQAMASNLSFGVIAIAVLIAIGLIWIARRSVLLPIRKLTDDLQQVIHARSVADLEQISQLLHRQKVRRDEVGKLSQTLSRMIELQKETFETLEKQVEERTLGLQSRRTQLEVAAQVARDIAAMRDVENLLNSSVNLIRDRFNFYHAGIFLNDQRREYALLRAATGEAGRELLARGHKLTIGQTGLVGYVAQTGEARIASDVDLDAVHFKNPLLPETRAEAAIPLKVAGQVIGVLDVQSQEAAAFDKESVTILQVLADQLAIAIQNAHLLQESQESLQALESAYGRLNRRAWQSYLRGSQVIGYEFDGVSAAPILAGEKTSSVQDRMAASDFVGEAGDIPTPRQPFKIPLRVRDEVVGSLDVWPQDAELTDAEVYLLASISNRISQIFESTRLLQEAQRLAWREQQVNAIASQMHNSVNLETILQSTVRELGKSLGAARTFIQIGGNSPSQDIHSPEDKL